MDKLKYIKLENQDGSYTDNIPLAVDSNYVDVNGTSLTNTIATLATKTEVAAVASGGPAGIYATVAALTAADPNHSKIYVVSADGHWYYYNSGWQDGGIYQAIEIENDSISYNKLNTQLKKIYYECYLNKQNQKATKDGFFKYSTGQVTIHSDYQYEVYAVIEGEKYYFSTRTASDARPYVITDALDNVLMYSTETSNSVHIGFVEIPRNGTKLYINSRKDAYGVYSCIKCNKLTLNKEYPLENNYTIGYINSSGEIRNESSELTDHSIVNVVPIKLKKGDVISSKYQYTIAKYDGDGSFISRTDLRKWNEIVEDGYYRITLFNYDNIPIINSFNTDSILSDEMVLGLKINKKFNKACYLHISIDDVYACLYDITINANTYSSIFENSFFADLKDLHEQYGCVFTLNTFNQDTHQALYDIANTTIKFKEEFNYNSDWLKFSFHAENNQTYYSNDDVNITTSYDKFVTAVLSFATYNNIDNFIRLGFFTGNSNNIDALLTTDYRPHGLFTADDSRLSYYLNQTQTDFINNNIYAYDSNKNLYLIKSQTRLENLGSSTIDLRLYDTKYMCEIFTHEQNWNSTIKTKLASILRQAVQLNYHFIYFEDLLQLNYELPIT